MKKIEKLNTLSSNTNRVYVKIQTKLNQSQTLSNLEQGFFGLIDDIKFLFLLIFFQFM